jgi:hypothetical protein
MNTFLTSSVQSSSPSTPSPATDSMAWRPPPCSSKLASPRSSL